MCLSMYLSVCQKDVDWFLLNLAGWYCVFYERQVLLKYKLNLSIRTEVTENFLFWRLENCHFATFFSDITSLDLCMGDVKVKCSQHHLDKHLWCKNEEDWVCVLLNKLNSALQIKLSSIGICTIYFNGMYFLSWTFILKHIFAFCFSPFKRCLGVIRKIFC